LTGKTPLGQVLAACQACLQTAGVTPAVAASVASALVAAEAEGNHLCGLYYLPVFLVQLGSGRICKTAVARVERRLPAALAISADGGFAQPALDLAVTELIPMARANGVAIACIRQSYNALALGQPAGALARHGLIALVVANAPAALAVPGSARPVFGTNPLAFAVPLPGAPPLIIDQSASAITKTEVMQRAASGRALEPGWAQDATGQPTLDAQAGLAGALLPSGGRKGANIALMVEVLAAVLPGAMLSAVAESLGAADRPHPGLGQTLIAIDPALFGTAASLPVLISVLTADGQRLPGQRRAERAAKAAAQGLALSPDLRALLGITA